MSKRGYNAFLVVGLFDNNSKGYYSEDSLFEKTYDGIERKRRGV